MKRWRVSRISDHEGLLVSTREWMNSAWWNIPRNEAGRSFLSRYVGATAENLTGNAVARCEVE